MRKNKIFVACDSSNISKVKKIISETQNPKITYRNLSLPVQNLKIYIDFFSVLKSSPRIIKTNLII